MAEDNLEGFDDLDNLLDEGESSESGGDFSQELDDFLGGEEAGGESAGGGESDSELDSFFEDLSTIDDLEVLQEEEPQQAAAAAAAAPAAAATAEERPAKEPKRAKAPKEKKARKKGGGFLRKLVVLLVLLGILGGGGYYLYMFFFPEGELPWEVFKQPQEPQQQEEQMVFQQEEPPAPPPEPEPQAQPEPEPAPPPEPEPEPAPPPEPEPQAQPEPEPTGPTYGIQVATCFFSSCVDNFRSLLEQQQRSVKVTETTSRSESLEIYSRTRFNDRAEAENMAQAINSEHRLEGNAYVFSEDGAYRLSMGTFSDLSRANVVKDALNQKYNGEVVFSTRLKDFPYTLRRIVTGKYRSREQAQQALARLKQSDERFGDAFIVRN